MRLHIADNTRAWKAIRESGMEIEGDALKRVPMGFDPSHPFAEDLKRKDFYISTAFTDEEVCSPEFLERVERAFRDSAPLVKFLTRAMDLPW